MNTVLVEYHGNSRGEVQSKWAIDTIFECNEKDSECWNVVRIVKKGKNWGESNVLTSFFKFNGKVLKEDSYHEWFQDGLFTLD
jgi:hypothetical protein